MILSDTGHKKISYRHRKFRNYTFSKKISLYNAKKFRFIAFCVNFTQIFNLKCDKIWTKVTKMSLKLAKMSYFCHHLGQNIRKNL